MSTIKFKNQEINYLKRHLDNMNKKLKDVQEDFNKNLSSKNINIQINNMILTELYKIVKKLSRKYSFDYKEAIEYVSKSKLTDSTPSDLKDGIVDEEFNEIYKEEKEKTDDPSTVYMQILIQDNKYYTKDLKIFDKNLTQVGEFIPKLFST